MNPLMRRDEPTAISDVNVVPLADVSLVLLIILLVLSPMMAQSSLKVKAAGESAGAPAPATVETAPELVLVVGLDSNGITLGSRRLESPGELMGLLKDELAGRADKKVFLAPGPEVPHGLVVHTLETIKACGADSVALVQTRED
jgi:biopolymer transport protein ExbD